MGERVTGHRCGAGPASAVTFQGVTAPALTIVASTGGHVTDVERFAITGVRPA